MADSFSGTHPFRPQCAITSIINDWSTYRHDLGDVSGPAADRVVEVVERVEAGRCPRCLGPLPDGQPEHPAGSRVIACRCIPICGRCGSDEVIQPQLGRPMSRVWQWPVSKGAITRRRNQFAAAHPSEPAVMVAGSDGAPLLLTDEGIAELINPCDSGGWAQYGYDDSADREERSR